MKVGTKIGITALIILFIFCLGINIWYLGLLLFGDRKIISDTYEVGLQKITNSEGIDEYKYFVEVNLMDDVFEVKFNYMLDENQTAFYSQGLQFIANEQGNIEFPLFTSRENEELVDQSGFWFLETRTYNRYRVGHNTKESRETFNFYNYMSSNNYETCLDSINSISNDSLFKIQLGNDLYAMKFKGTSIGFNDFNDLKLSDAYVKDGHVRFWYSSLSYAGDVINMASLLYDSVKILPNGTNEVCVFEFADMFDYYEYDEDTKTYSKDAVSIDRAELIKKSVKSYYAIKVTKSEGKIQKASESLFKCVAGNPGYNISDDIESEDYFVGRTTIDTFVYNFDLVQVNGNSYALKLNKKFIDKYKSLKDVIVLDILINLDFFKENNYQFVGFTADNGLDEFNVLQCRTMETIDSEIVYSEVSYA